MDKDLIKSIVRCAFKICFYYFLKCFLPLTVIDSHGSFDIKLLKQIHTLKKLVLHLDSEVSESATISETIGSDSTSTSTSASTSTCSNLKPNSFTDGSNCSSTDNSSENNNDTKHIAYEKIKENITNQLKEKYGSDTQIEFNMCDDIMTKEKENMICALKIKEMGKIDPDPEKYGKSDIYVNTKTKTFHVRTLDGFQTFPLGKKSIVRCEKSDD